MRSLCRFFPASAASAPPTAPAPDPDFAYAAADTTLTYDLRGERLIDVAKKIARLSARNVIVPEPLYDCKVSGYVRRMPFDVALRMLATPFSRKDLPGGGYMGFHHAPDLLRKHLLRGITFGAVRK